MMSVGGRHGWLLSLQMTNTIIIAIAVGSLDITRTEVFVEIMVEVLLCAEEDDDNDDELVQPSSSPTLRPHQDDIS